tara:strand:- start:20438 stop:21220 length:783 start_codon:yes stop_codon:yes gene_type:complete
MRLKNRLAIVTGGSSGIGRAIALALSNEGAYVIVADIDESPRRGKYHEKSTTTPTVDEISKSGGQGTFMQCDMSDENSIRKLVDKTVKKHNRVDILVNNAGICFNRNSQETTTEDFDNLVDINLRGVFLATKYAVPHIKKSETGRIINIASVHAFHGGGGPAYAASKAGVVNLTKDTALELAPHGGTVNAICPGYIETAIQDELTEQDIKDSIEKTPLPRLGLPKDIGLAALFLASDDAEWITGISLIVDGGMLAPLPVV